jgi:hypothetical protein
MIMQLTYTNPQETTIKVTLDEGENLGDLYGPIEASVPTDPGNRHYVEILEQGYSVPAYEPPEQPTIDS